MPTDLRTLRRPFTWILLVFFASGVPALVHELVWHRQLTLILGHGYFAVSAVTAAFMLGLGLGAWVGGMLADRATRPLLLYAVAELLIALYAACFPWLGELIVGLFRWLYPSLGGQFLSFNLVQFGVLLLALLPPTLAMGATFPLMLKSAIRADRQLGQRGGLLYGSNTIGAAVGVFLGGMLLLPAFGLWGSLGLACGMNGLLALAGWALDRRLGPAPLEGTQETGTPEPKKKDKKKRKQRKGTDADPVTRPTVVERLGPGPLRGAIAIGLALSGFLSLGYQLLWVRVLTRVFGPTPYAFPLVLFPFILFLGLGGLLGSLLQRLDRPVRTLALLQTAIAGTVLLTFPLLSAVPLWVSAGLSRPDVEAWSLWLSEMGWTTSILAVPTALLGACLPVGLALWDRGPGRSGRSGGAVYLANTLGAVAGAVATGYLILPHLGLTGSLQLLVTSQCVGGLLLMGLVRSWPSLGVQVGLGGLVLLMAWNVRPADLVTIESTPYLYGRQQQRSAEGNRMALREYLAQAREVLFYGEDLLSSVSVTRDPRKQLSIRVGGKAIAGKGDAPTFRLLAHLPLAARPRAERVLIIGLGAGMTLRSATLHPLEQIDCVEISRGVLKAARLPEVAEVFHKGAIDDPRVTLINQDGRTHVALTDRTYDVIISQPTNLWIDGIPGLLSREFYQLAHRRLRPGGVFAQWVQGYRTSRAVFGSWLNTFAEAFEHVVLWETVPGVDYLVLGSREPIRLGLHHLLELGPVRKELAAAGVGDRPRLLAGFLGQRQAVLGWTGQAPIHTDPRNYVGYRAARDVLRPDMHFLTRKEHPLPRSKRFAALLAGAPPGAPELGVIARRREARLLTLRMGELLGEGRQQEAEEMMLRARALDPQLLTVRYALESAGRAHLVEAERHRLAGRHAQAEASYRRVVSLAPNRHWQAHYNLAKLIASRGQLKQALSHLRVAHAQAPQEAAVVNNLAGTLARLGRYPEAIPLLRGLLGRDPDNIVAMTNLGTMYLRSGQKDQARAVWRRLLQVDPTNSRVRKLLKSLGD